MDSQTLLICWRDLGSLGCKVWKWLQANSAIVFAGAAAIKNPTSDARFDFSLDKVVHNLSNFLTQVGRRIQARKLERLEGNV
jgi:hypothetical protein